MVNEEDIPNKFWKKWDEADLIDKPKILQEVITPKVLEGIKITNSYSLLNSYFEDLQIYAEEQAKQELLDKIEKKFSMQHACDCPEWCACWEDFRKQEVENE